MSKNMLISLISFLITFTPLISS